MDHSSIIMAYRLIHSNLNRSHRKKHGKSKEQQVSKDGDSYEWVQLTPFRRIYLTMALEFRKFNFYLFEFYVLGELINASRKY